MTGPSKKMTRHSSLSVVKKSLFQGKVYKEGYRRYNNFGSATHQLYLLGKPGKWKLTPLEKRMRDGMIKKLRSHPIAQKVLESCPVREKRRKTRLFGVPFHFTPDGHGKVKGLDLKTTACTTQKDFELSAKQYGYFRQGDTYDLGLRSLKAAALEEYWILGTCKKFPHPVFPILIQSHPKQMAYVRQEFLLLLYIFKFYGDPVKHKREKGKRHR